MCCEVKEKCYVILAQENVSDVSNNEDEWSAKFDISDEFITRFVKSKDALSDLDTFTVETRDGFNGEELVFTVGRYKYYKHN